MIGDISLYFDEDVHLSLANAARVRGVDGVHAYEVGRSGRLDEEQLGYAVEHGRCVFTFNVRDFVVLHVEYMNVSKEHFGIIVAPQRPIGLTLRALLGFLHDHTAGDVKSQIFFL